MSTSALAVVNEGAALVGDPGFSRITQEEWRVYLNTAARDLARKMRLVRWIVTYDLVLNGPEYALPPDCFQIIRMHYNLTPSNQTTWFKIDEIFQDEFDQTTNGNYASGLMQRYLALNDTFWLYPMPDKNVVAGGRIAYWGMPDEVTTLASGVIPVMDILRDSLRERMVIFALRRLEKFDAAQRHELEWEASLTSERDRLEDRSADRRPQIRPGSWAARNLRTT